MKGVLDEYSIDSWLTSDEWDHLQDMISEEYRALDVLGDRAKDSLPFMLYFEHETVAKLLNAGFDKDVIDSPKRFEKVLKGLEKEGTRIYGTWNEGPYGYPTNVITFSNDRKCYWIRTDIGAALRALKSIRTVKALLKDKQSIEVYLRSLEMIVNLLRSGNAPQLARAEAGKLDKSKWTRVIKKAIMRNAIKSIFEKFPGDQHKTLGFVWSKFDFVNSRRPVRVVNKDTGQSEVFTVKTGKSSKGQDIVIIAGESRDQYEYSKRSLQHFIDELK